MKFAIPLAEGKLALHFGHCRHFALVKVNVGGMALLQKEIVEAPPHEPGLLPKWLGEKGVTHVIAGGMGQKAKSLFEQNGIKVTVGAKSLEPEELIQQYLNDSLDLGENGCSH
jgi:predicted Fe-Mo cluster-binding NifX family protein